MNNSNIYVCVRKKPANNHIDIINILDTKIQVIDEKTTVDLSKYNKIHTYKYDFEKQKCSRSMLPQALFVSVIFSGINCLLGISWICCGFI